MTPSPIAALRATFPHLTHWRYYLFPGDYKAEDAQYHYMLARLVATNIRAAQEQYMHPTMSCLDKAREYFQSHDPRTLRDVAVVVTIVFFAVLACVLIGIALL